MTRGKAVENGANYGFALQIRRHRLLSRIAPALWITFGKHGKQRLFSGLIGSHLGGFSGLFRSHLAGYLGHPSKLSTESSVRTGLHRSHVESLPGHLGHTSGICRAIWVTRQEKSGLIRSHVKIAMVHINHFRGTTGLIGSRVERKIRRFLLAAQQLKRYLRTCNLLIFMFNLFKRLILPRPTAGPQPRARPARLGRSPSRGKTRKAPSADAAALPRVIRPAAEACVRVVRCQLFQRDAFGFRQF